MVANLSHPKKGFEDRLDCLDAVAVRGQAIKDAMLAAVDADTAAFDGLLDAMRLPGGRRGEGGREPPGHATVAASRSRSASSGCRKRRSVPRDRQVGLQASRSMPAWRPDSPRRPAPTRTCINMPGLTDRSRGAGCSNRADAAFTRARALHDRAEAEILAGLGCRGV
jgi:glutamate formiminotransferase/formiminotetrahydrofolate cyclodeaminase